MLESLKTSYMVRSRPNTTLKTFNIDYVRAMGKEDAIENINDTILARGHTIIDVLEPGEEAYGLSKKDIQALFRAK